MVTVEDCQTWISSSTGAVVSDTDPLLPAVLAAVEAHLSAHYVRPDEAEAGDWDLATMMLTARWWARRQSPSGVAGVNDFGVVRVSRVDPDIASLLTAFRDHSDV